ncbi:MAG: gliding motility-associated C-terminal domain-containing protein, partial [Saprospiraceae bacterium]
GCMVMDEVTVTVAGALTVSAGIDQATCEGEGVQLAATGGERYVWTPSTGLSNPNIANPIATPQTITTYTVEVTNTSGCVGRDEMVVTVHPKPTVKTVDDQMICVGENTMLSATGAISYVWSPATGLNVTNTPTPIASPTVTTTYTVVGTDANGCTSTDEVTVIVGGNAQANAGADVTLCVGAATSLSASGGVIYSWIPTTGLDNPNIANPTASPNGTTTYTVTVTNLEGCIGTDQVTVSVNGFIAANAGADQTVCSGSTVYLNATGGSNCVWSPATGLNNPNVPNPVATINQTTTYTVTCFDANGCTSTDQVTIFVNDNINVGISPNVSTCGSQPVALNATGGTTYSWSPATGLSNPNIANPIANPTQTTTYCVTTTNAQGCTGTACTTVTVSDRPTVVGCPDKYICNGGSVRLTVNGGVSWTWSPATGLDNPNSPAPNASPSVTTTYTVTGTDAFGCSASDLVVVFVNEGTGITAGPDQTTCAGGTVQLTANGGATYNWSPTFGLNNPNIANPTLTPIATTTYTVTSTTAEGCTGTDQVTVFVNNAVQVNAGANQTVCAGGTAQLSASGGISYSWSPTFGLSNPNIANPTVTPIATTTYTVTVRTAGGCTVTDQVTVAVGNTATVNAGADQRICSGGSAFLNANGGTTYNWSPATGLSNPNIANPVATPAATTIYTVTTRTANGCTASDQITINVMSPITTNPTVAASGCCNDDGNINLNVSGGAGGYTYSWTPNVSTSTTAFNLSPGNYSVVITDLLGCNTIAYINLTQDCNTACTPISPEREVCVAQGATVGELCLPVRQADISQYLITIPGQMISPSHGCDFTNLTAYSYALLQGEGNSGPYKVDSWTVNGTAHTTMVNNTAELTAWMNSIDPAGNWLNYPSILSISGGNPTTAYSDMKITHQITWVETMLNPNVTGVAMSTLVEIPMGNAASMVMTIRNLNTCCEETVLLTRCVDNTPVPVACSEEIVTMQQTTVTTTNCNTGGQVCVDIPLERILDYSLTVNGATYNGGFAGCNFDTLYAYTYFTMPNRGASGPYNLRSWSVDGVTFSGRFNNLTDLVNLMNTWDTSGNWFQDPSTLTLQGGVAGKSYGAMDIEQLNTGAFAILELNSNLVPLGTTLTFSTGVNNVTLTNNFTLCQDQFTVTVVCNESKLKCEDFIASTAEQLSITSCNETIGFCVEIPASELGNYTIDQNGEMYTGAVEKCETDANSIQLYAGEGKHIFTFTNELTGCEDGIVIKVSCLNIGSNKTTTTNSGLSIGKSTTPSVDKSNGLPIATDNEVATMMNEASVIEVTAGDRAADVITTVNILEAPKHGTLTINADNTVTYQPEEDYCEPQQPDFFRYEICNGQGCEAATVKVTVACAPIKVYNALSPNRDDINDYFMIEGLEAYPENELKIFNRFGKVLYEKTGYDNSWGGEIDGEILPNGTYFYILSDGKGGQHSGFINIQR